VQASISDGRTKFLDILQYILVVAVFKQLQQMVAYQYDNAIKQNNMKKEKDQLDVGY
jgi:Na+-translocating ferredoxin:NAD+ oxidoreductase RnfA subunit